MKDYKKYWLYGLLIMVIACGLYSCDDEKYDVEGNPSDLLYFRNNWSPASLPSNSYLFKILRTPIGGTGDDVFVKIPVRTTRSFDLDVTVSAEIDNSLVEKYNTKYGTDHKIFPEGSVSWVKTSVKLAAGAYESSDSLEFTVSKNQYEKFIATSYLLPVRLTNASTGTISSTESVIWTFVKSEYKLIKDNVGVNEMPGKLVEDYSGWTIFSTDEPTLNYTTCLDGNQNTGVRFSNVKNPTIVVDMKGIHKMCGMRVLAYPYSWGNYYDLSSVIMEVSSDNSTWTRIGIANAMAKSGYYQLIAFYEGIDARYIRLSLTWLNGSSSSYRNLREVGVYVIE